MKELDLALIGHPISSNISYQYHQTFLSKIGSQDTYGKFDVTPENLKPFLDAAKANNMTGLSVTMPLKECILPLLDEVELEAQKMGAVNTVAFRNGQSYGYNVDGIGAIKAIQSVMPNLKDKRALIVGAGGVAKAIAYMLKNTGTKVLITNRTLEKAEKLALKLNADVIPYKDITATLLNVDMLIQATTVGMTDAQQILLPEAVPNHVLVFDVLSSPKNHWLNTLAQQGCQVVPGRLMWLYQAIEQYRIWYDNQLDLSHAFQLFQAIIEQNSS